MQQTQVLIEETVVEEFRGTFSGAVLRREDEGYDAARSVFNGMYDRRPTLIARCSCSFATMPEPDVTTNTWSQLCVCQPVVQPWLKFTTPQL